MTFRLISYFVVLLFTLIPGLAVAQVHGDLLEMNRLQAQLSVINAEIKSELDQVLVLQAAIKANMRLPLAEQGRSPDPVMVSDLAIAQRQAIQRELELNARIEALLARSAVHDARKQRLLDRVRELGAVQ